jgi:HEAT repeat protein
MIATILCLLSACQADKEVIHPDFLRYFKSSPILKQAAGGKIIQIPEGFVLLGVSAYSVVGKGADELVQAEEEAVKKARASLVGTKGIRVYSVTRVEDESTVKIEDEKESGNNLSKITAVNEEVITGKVAGSEVVGRWLSADGAERFVAVGVKINKKGEKLPYLADFQVILKEVLEGGKTDSTKAMIEQMDQSWRTRLVSACESNLRETSSSRRAAAVSALGWGLSRWDDGEDLFIRSLDDPDALVCKAATDTFVGTMQVKAGPLKALIRLARVRKDSARESALGVLAHIKPESIDIIDIVYRAAMEDDSQITGVCVRSLEGRNIGHKRRMELAKHLIKGADRPNRLSGLRMLATQKDDDRQAVLDGLLTETGSVDPATSQAAATFVETLLPLGGEDRATLAAHLGQGKPSQRLLSAQLVASMGPQGASLVPAIVQMLGDPDQRLVVIALSTLGNMGVPSLVPLEKIREKAGSDSRDIRLAAINAMTDLGAQSGCQAQLVEALGDSSRLVARAASRGLAKYSPAFSKENAGMLRKSITSRNQIVKRFTFRTLAELAPVDSVLSNEAVSGLFDSDRLVQFDSIRICSSASIIDRGTIQRVTKILSEIRDGKLLPGKLAPEKISAELATVEAAPSMAFITSGKSEAMGCLIAPRLVISSKTTCGSIGQVSFISFSGSPVFSGRQLKGKTIKVHPELDLALVELESNPAIPSLPLASSPRDGETTEVISLEAAGDFAVGVKIFSQNAKLESRDGPILKVQLAVPGQMGGCVLIGLDGTVRGLKVAGEARSGNQWDYVGSAAILDWLGNGIEVGRNSQGKYISEELGNAEISAEKLAGAALQYIAMAGPAASSAKPVLIDYLKSAAMVPVRKESYAAIASLKGEGVSLVDDLLDLTLNPMARGYPSLQQFSDSFLSAGENTMICETLAAFGAPAAKRISEGLLRRQPEAKFMALLAIEKMGTEGKEAKALVYRSSLAINEKNLYIQAQAKRTHEKLERLTKNR